MIFNEFKNNSSFSDFVCNCHSCSRKFPSDEKSVTCGKARQTHVDDFVEVGVLARRVLVLAQHVLNGLSGQQVAHFLLLEV